MACCQQQIPRSFEDLLDITFDHLQNTATPHEDVETQQILCMDESSQEDKKPNSAMYDTRFLRPDVAITTVSQFSPAAFCHLSGM